MLERTAPGAENLFLDDLRTGGYAAVWDEQDLDRIQRLIGKYGDLPLGFADACVIACAERYGGRVLTTDRRHFEVVARGEKSVDLLPTILS
jgi:predicted nucleic acid-binding protein